VIVGLDLVPEIELVAPTGTIEDGYGDPEFVWNGIGTAVSYKLWVGKAGSATPVFFLQDLPLSYCVDLICTVDPVAISEANRLANGNYVVWVGANRVGAKTVWFGPFNFTLNAPQPVIPTLGTTTETTTFTPTLNWTLEGTAANLSWFEVYVVPSSTPSKPEIRKWVKRGNVCGSVDGTTCSYEVTLARNNTEYQFWMRGWGPGGYTTGGAGNLQQWAGPETFTIVVALPNPPQNIVVDPRQGRPLISWDDDPNATYFQVWLGPNPKGNFKQWFKAVDVCVGGTCAITPAIDWPSTGNPYQVWMRAYGPAGFSTGGSNGWIQAPDLLTLPTLPPEPPSNLGPAADSAPDPTFTWDGMANATWYKFIIEPQDERWSYKKWVLGYDLSQACGDATGTCSWTDPALGADKLPPGIYNVRVFAWGPAGYSALPATIQFAYKQP
jgi:hypothetical protein